MRQICLDCGAVFARGLFVDCTFDHGFGRRRAGYEACPRCLSPRIAAAADCPRCGGDMMPGERLCIECRRTLARRFARFVDALHPAETAQLDDWLDGATLEERGRWV